MKLLSIQRSEWVVGARDSPLSRAQVQEVQRAFPHLLLKPIFMKTTGDIDRCQSLRNLNKTDFFTKELDEMVLQQKCHIAIHSAKDLPEPLPQGLALIALTKGLDPRDALVMREGQTLYTLPSHATIATSSEHREHAVSRLRAGFRFVDLRGTIHERLALLENAGVDGVVVAECALIRLKLTHLNRIILPGPTTPLQGKLAIIGRSDEQAFLRNRLAAFDGRHHKSDQA